MGAIFVIIASTILINNMCTSTKNDLPVLDFEAAALRLKNVASRTPLQFSRNLSRQYKCSVYLKREDLQIVRSYKIRGAYNMISSLSEESRTKGVVCASAGNHAQGFAYSCKQLGIRGVVFMPVITPKQKITQTRMFGDDMIEIILIGDTFDDCAFAAKKYTQENNMIFIPPFEDYKIIEGQGTVAKEILEENIPGIDYLFVPVGGGGLAAGIGLYFNKYSPDTKIIGVEPLGAPSMHKSLIKGSPVTLEKIDRFVDGAAVKRVGDITFSICKEILEKMVLIPEGKVCTTILKLYNEDAIVLEPAGALSIAALDDYKKEIEGKTVVCIVSGSNNDIDRIPEIKELSLQYEGLKRYFLISFAQRPGALKDFVNDVLGKNDDITRFEYIHKTNKERGPALVGIELLHKSDHKGLIERMDKNSIDYLEINKDDKIFGLIV